MKVESFSLDHTKVRAPFVRKFTKQVIWLDYYLMEVLILSEELIIRLKLEVLELSFLKLMQKF